MIVGGTWDVARRRPDALEVPDGFASVGKVVGEEASAVLTVENARESPLVARQGTQVQNLHDQQVAGHRRSAFRVRHPYRPTQVVNLQPIQFIAGSLVGLKAVWEPNNAQH